MSLNLNKNYNPFGGIAFLAILALSAYGIYLLIMKGF